LPDSSDPVYQDLLKELSEEFSYTFGGCTITSSSGKYHSLSGVIMPDKIHILFTDIPCLWNNDRLPIERYVENVRKAVKKALAAEEAILVVVYPVYHFA
jgi:hypothetical protein